MRKTLTALAIAGLAVLGVTACGGDPTTPQNTEAGDTSDASPQTSGEDGSSVDFSAPHACDLLTVEIATTALGVPAKLSDGGRSTDVTRGGARFSQCSYFPADPAHGLEQAALAIDAPVDASGVAWAETGFDGMTTIDPTATPVDGYGDKALWSPKTGQLVVMAKGMWLSFMVGAGIDVTTYTLEDARRLADALLPTL